MKILDYLRLIKFKYHFTFVSVIAGMFLFNNWPLLTFLQNVLIVYLSFNVLLYGGLYILNDIKDVESDRKHPLKKNRPIAANKVSVLSAFVFAISCILSGLAIGYLVFGKKALVMYFLFILINQFYTNFAKRIPYFEFLINALSHPMRFILGVILVTNEMPYLIVLAVLLLSLGIACARRLVEVKEIGSTARPVLRYYTPKMFNTLISIFFVLLVLIPFVNFPQYIFVYIVIIAIYLVFALGPLFSKKIASFYSWAR